MRLMPSILIMLGALTCPARAEDDVIARLCREAACSGKGSRLEIWRRPDGTAHRYVHAGDFGRCVHPPTMVFDAKLKVIGGHPFPKGAPGSVEERRADAQMARLLRGLTKSETTACP